MSFLRLHQEHLGEQADVMLARLEGVAGLLRRPLMDLIQHHRVFLHDNILARPPEALALHGVTPPADADALAVEARDEIMAELERLLQGLERNEDRAIHRFVEALTSRMRAGVDSRAGISTPSIAVLLAADSAFHLYRYFIDILEVALGGFEPRTALQLRR